MLGGTLSKGIGRFHSTRDRLRACIRTFSGGVTDGVGQVQILNVEWAVGELGSLAKGESKFSASLASLMITHYHAISARAS